MNLVSQSPRLLNDFGSESFPTREVSPSEMISPYIESHPIQHALPVRLPMNAHWQQYEHMATHIPNQAPAHEDQREELQSRRASHQENSAPSSWSSAALVPTVHQTFSHSLPAVSLGHDDPHANLHFTTNNLSISQSLSSAARNNNNINSPNGFRNSAVSSSVEADSVIKHSDLECPVCYLLLCEPITLSCGHSFCRQCMVLCLEQNKKQCPVCRTACFLQPETHPTNVLLSSLIQKMFPAEYNLRQQDLAQSRQHWHAKFPVFVYNTPYFPNQPLMMHFYEPRYKIMMQRVLPTTRKFAIIPPSPNGKLEAGAVGTIFEVTQYELLPDQRVLVHAVGRSRVSVSSCWVEPDTYGLDVATVVELDDDRDVTLGIIRDQLTCHPNLMRDLLPNYPDAQQSSAPSSSSSSPLLSPTPPVSLTDQQIREAAEEQMHRVMRQAYEDMKQMLILLPVNRGRLLKSFGMMPGGFDGQGMSAPGSPKFWADCVSLSYWLISALPLSVSMKIAMLRTRCTLERLSTGVNALHTFSDNLRLRIQERLATADASREMKIDHVGAMHPAPVSPSTPSNSESFDSHEYSHDPLSQSGDLSPSTPSSPHNLSP